MHPIVVSTKEKPFVCKDDSSCHFRTCDPASLLRHRKNLHQYIPRTRRKTVNSFTAPTAPTMDSSGSPSTTIYSPPHFPPSHFSPFGESSTTSYYSVSSSKLVQINFFRAKPNFEFQIPDNTISQLLSEDPNCIALVGLIKDLDSLESGVPSSSI